MSSGSPRAVRMIRWYQRAFDGRLSPCRFTPSCSSYALEAFENHGTRRGASLTVRRLIRCRPFGPSGWDPVPEATVDHRGSSVTGETLTGETLTCQKGC
jgi:uncharacterized protein